MFFRPFVISIMFVASGVLADEAPDSLVWVPLGKTLTFKTKVSVPQQQYLFFQNGMSTTSNSLQYEDKCILSFVLDSSDTSSGLIDIPAGATATVESIKVGQVQTDVSVGNGYTLTLATVLMTTKLGDTPLYVMCDKGWHPRQLVYEEMMTNGHVYQDRDFFGHSFGAALVMDSSRY